MSSKPEQQNEPTMEEILASIRRIISEDEPQGGSPAEDVPVATPPTAATVSETEPPAVAGGGADNILDLTRMVAEDGSIVELAAASPEEPAVEGAPEAEDVPEEAPESAPEEAAPEEAAAEAPETASGEAFEETPEEPLEEAAAEQPEAVAASDEEPSAEELLAPAADPSADEEAVDEAEEEPAPVPAPATALGEESEFVSAVTARAATASLAAVTKAAMANRQANAVAIGGGRTLEELVRESLAPELKGWLDENLPDLVERIVREEIRKMVRRAEDQ